MASGSARKSNAADNMNMHLAAGYRQVHVFACLGFYLLGYLAGMRLVKLHFTCSAIEENFHHRRCDDSRN